MKTKSNVKSGYGGPGYGYGGPGYGYGGPGYGG